MCLEHRNPCVDAREAPHRKQSHEINPRRSLPSSRDPRTETSSEALKICQLFPELMCTQRERVSLRVRAVFLPARQPYLAEIAGFRGVEGAMEGGFETFEHAQSIYCPVPLHGTVMCSNVRAKRPEDVSIQTSNLHWSKNETTLPSVKGMCIKKAYRTVDYFLVSSNKIITRVVHNFV